MITNVINAKILQLNVGNVLILPEKVPIVYAKTPILMTELTQPVKNVNTPAKTAQMKKIVCPVQHKKTE